MTVQPSDVFQILRDIQKQAEILQAKAADALKLLSALNLPEQPVEKCKHCGLETRGPRTLADHLYTCHGGPLPDHEVRLNERTLEPALPGEDD